MKQASAQTDQSTTLQALKDARAQFNAERGWSSSTLRSMAISIVLEAAELLEHFQWDDYQPAERQDIADELADVLSYCVSFAGALDIDIATAFFAKLERAKQKYPVETFHPGHDDEAAYRRIKQAYRAGNSNVA